MSDVEVAIGFWWKSGMDGGVLSRSKVITDDLFYEVNRF